MQQVTGDFCYTTNHLPHRQTVCVGGGNMLGGTVAGERQELQWKLMKECNKSERSNNILNCYNSASADPHKKASWH